MENQINNFNVTHTDKINEITKAFLAFDSTVGKIGKDAKNPFFKSNYASLSKIMDGIYQPLIDAGLTVRQFPVGMHGLTTYVIHAESGEYFCATMEMKPAKQDPQGQGSAITYMRRYAVCAILGLNIDEDDDARCSSNNSGAKNTAKVDYDKEKGRLLKAINTASTTKELDALSKYVEKYNVHDEFDDKLLTLKSKVNAN